MSDRQALFAALQHTDTQPALRSYGDREAFVQAFIRLGRSASSRHALRIDATRYAARQVRSDDYGTSGLALVGFAHGTLLADRLSGPLAPFTRPLSSQLASAQALWCLAGPKAPRPELPEMLLIGDLPQDPYALSHALFTFVREKDALQAGEVIDRLLDQGIDRDRLVGMLARVVTECSTDYRPFLLLSSALQLSARLGGDEVGNLLHAAVRGAISVLRRPPPGELPPRTALDADVDEEIAQLLTYQVKGSGVADLRRLRAQVRDGEGSDAWRAVLKAIRAKVDWERIVDALSLEAALRLQCVRPSSLETGSTLGQVLEAMAQVRAVRWMMQSHPSPGALKAVVELAAHINWLRFAVAAEEPVDKPSEQRATALLNGLREALKARDRGTVLGHVARYRELNLPREGLAGVLAEEAVRGSTSPEGLALRLMVTDSALGEAQSLYGSMEEGSYFQGLARVLTMVPGEDTMAPLFSSRS